MRVRAIRNTRDAAGWHLAGQVFDTEENLGDAVEILDAPKKAPEEPVTAPEKEPEKPKSAAKRRKASE